LQFEYAELSLIGGREENQDRIVLVKDQDAALLVVADGMGGHADGAKAAEVASETITDCFSQDAHPVLDPQGFLHRAIGQAHANLVAIGPGLRLEVRPRSTCVVCLIQDGAAYWAHVGDSRIYLIRNQAILERTRDHSHVEFLLQEGVITEDQILEHPMRNFVECCLGGDAILPGMTVSNQKRLEPGDMLLVCSDGFWSGLNDEDIAALGTGTGRLSGDLRRLGEQAVKAGGSRADNTSAIALRWEG